jgi:endonuclease YncB( thermonuclease family)
MIFKALALSIVLLIGIGLVVPLTTDSSEAAVRKPSKHRKKYRKYKKYSKKWWRAYRLRVRKRKALLARKRALRLRLIRLANVVAPYSSGRTVASESSDRNENLRLLIEGAVVEVYDGSMVGVKTADGALYRIGMLGARAPDAGQNFAQRARLELSGLILGKEVTVMIRKKISSGEYLGTVYYGGEDINLKQIENGMARYIFGDANAPIESDRRLYERAEQKARVERSGLWGAGSSKNRPCFSRVQSSAKNCIPRSAARRKRIERRK